MVGCDTTAFDLSSAPVVSKRARSAGGPRLLPRRVVPSLVNVRVRVRDRRLRFTPLDVLVLLDVELERVRAAGRAEDGTGDDIGWAIEAFEVASNLAHDGDSTLKGARARALTPPALGSFHQNAPGVRPVLSL